MYLYFDKNGVLQEVINDKKIRSASDGANRILAYIEGDLEIDEINVVIKRADGSLSNEVSILNNKIYASIPYDKQRDLKFFKDFAEYPFYYYDLTFNDLQYSGLAYATITIYADGKAYAQGMVTFNIEKSVIKTDNLITQSQYQYLLLSYASRTLNEQTGKDLDTLITEKVDSHQESQFDERFLLYKNQVDALIKLQNESIDTFKQSIDIRFGLYVNNVDKKIANQNTTIKELGQLQPSGTDTSTNILSYTSSKGIYVATDNGHWYYWNASENKYVDGGIYIATELSQEVTEAFENINKLLYGEIILDRVETANNAYRDSEDNLIATYYASKSALSQANKEIANLKEALYGYVLDSTDVEINSVIPYTTTIGSNTYNLVDNAYGLIKEIRGNTIVDDEYGVFENLEYDGLNIVGSNLLNIADKEATTTNGITYSIKNGVLYLNGTSSSDTLLHIGSISNIKLNDVFTIKTFNSNVYFQYAFYNNDTWVITSNKFIDNATLQVSYENANKIELLVFISKDETISNSVSKPMLVKGSTTPTTFKPYKNPIYILNNLSEFSIILRGVGSAKDKIVITKNTDNEYYTATKITNIGLVDLGTLSWTYVESWNGKNLFYTKLTNAKFIRDTNLSLITGGYTHNEDLPPVDETYRYNNQYISTTENTLGIVDTYYTNLTDFVNHVSGIELQYELATPTTEVLSSTLTDSDVMPLLELGGSVDIDRYLNAAQGSTIIEMVYRLSGSTTTEVLENE